MGFELDAQHITLLIFTALAGVVLVKEMFAL